MTNIFARKPGHYPVPARRYEQFISAFEKRVAEIQKQVASIEAMQPLYIAARDALEAIDFKNDATLTLNPNTVNIKIVPLPQDRLVDCDRWIASIGAALKAAGLHEDGIGLERRAGYWWDIDVSWSFKRDGVARSIVLNVAVPLSGLADIEVDFTTEVVTTENRTYRYKPRGTSAASVL